MSRQLSAGTSTRQWVVDGYSLAFAALVLTGGSIGDRFGRRPVLLLGLVGLAGVRLPAGGHLEPGMTVAPIPRQDPPAARPNESCCNGYGC